MTDHRGSLLSSDIVGTPEAGLAPAVDTPTPHHVRRAADVLRLLVSLAALGLTVLLAVATRDFARKAQAYSPRPPRCRRVYATALSARSRRSPCSRRLPL
ncbi:hypothetical protein [Streptomyces sp. NPDC048419]|uniref:hypothetical protein n=1 Tax=Streptomyces sp. NPDC048419 TaxID=3365547 RepID=UPI00372438A4